MTQNRMWLDLFVGRFKRQLRWQLFVVIHTFIPRSQR